MKALTLILAHASADQVNCVVSHRDLRTPLHLACSAINLPVAQLLLWVIETFNKTVGLCTVMIRKYILLRVVIITFNFKHNNILLFEQYKHKII